ncbi:MAG: hypothetical protein AB7P01_16325 [Bacteroidia bacterium]
MKQLYLVLLLSAVFICYHHPVSAQTTAATKYVRLDIGHGGLHCPFLGPQLERKLTETGQVSNLKVYKKESYATFELPAATALSDADIRQVAIKVGYPDADVTVVVSDTAPVNQQ